MAHRISRPVCCPPEPAVDDAPPALPADDTIAEEQLAALARALAHPVRVRILRMLAHRDARMCTHIVDELPLAQSTVSEHLRILREAGLVRAREDGARTLYCIVPQAVEYLKALLERTLPSQPPVLAAAGSPARPRAGQKG
jgi:ArsR family transcriptional regulator